MALFTSKKKPSFLKQIIGLCILLFLVFMIPITISQSKKVQQTQSKASEGPKVFALIPRTLSGGSIGIGGSGDRSASTPKTGTTRPPTWTFPCAEDSMIMLERCSTNANDMRVRFCIQEVACPVQEGEQDGEQAQACYEMDASSVKQWNGWRSATGNKCTISGEATVVGGIPKGHCPESTCTQLGEYFGEVVTDRNAISGIEPSAQSSSIYSGSGGSMPRAIGGAAGGETQETENGENDSVGGIGSSIFESSTPTTVGNREGIVTDIVKLILDYYGSKDAAQLKQADINGDGEINMLDMRALIDTYRNQ